MKKFDDSVLTAISRFLQAEALKSSSLNPGPHNNRFLHDSSAGFFLLAAKEIVLNNVVMLIAGYRHRLFKLFA